MGGCWCIYIVWGEVNHVLSINIIIAGASGYVCGVHTVPLGCACRYVKHVSMHVCMCVYVCI